MLALLTLPLTNYNFNPKTEGYMPWFGSPALF